MHPPPISRLLSPLKHPPVPEELCQGAKEEEKKEKEKGEEGNTYSFELLSSAKCSGNKEKDAEIMLKLLDIKNVFARQLPKMPKDYISRLVFDKHHWSYLMYVNNPSKAEKEEDSLKKEEEEDENKGGLMRGETSASPLSEKQLIAGVCFRPFKERRFAEVVFLAVRVHKQVKGHGTRMMNSLKELGRYLGYSFLLTYADNGAIGYFRKQGFTKIQGSLNPRFKGFIKHYEGAECMGCRIYPQVDYGRVKETLRSQIEYVKDTIKSLREPSASDVQPGIPGSRFPLPLGNLLQILGGLREKCDDPANEAMWKEWREQAEKNSMEQVLSSVMAAGEKPSSSHWFREPVPLSVEGYYQKIQHPMDLSTIHFKNKFCEYRSHAEFSRDVRQIVLNSESYNGPTHPVTQAARKMEQAMLKTRLDNMVEYAPAPKKQRTVSPPKPKAHDL